MKSVCAMMAVISAAVFLLTVGCERILIPILKSHKLGQKILEIGPRWHKNKDGTPTMGGIGFIVPSLVVAAVFFILRAVEGSSSDWIPLALTLGFAVGNGLIGFVDDYCKLIKKQNEGLNWWQKLVLQLALAAAYVCVMAYTHNMTTVVTLFGKTLDLGWLYYVLAVLVLTGIVNGGNITDGIDGLAASVTCVIGGFYALWAAVVLSEQLGVIAALLVGSSLGFLVYNFHPARVFMGDTGSLYFGALTVGAAFMMNQPVVAVVVTAVFIVEMLSSLLQVGYFRLTHGKRLFKMAPLHHHFEKCGWGEVKIVAVFSAVQAVFCALAWFLL